MLTAGQYQRLVLNLSDERDQWRRLAWQLWHDGHQAAELAHADDYARGLVDGAYCRKRAQQDLVEAARLDRLRWGDAGREHFGDPRPGDFPGRDSHPVDGVRSDTPPSHRGGAYDVWGFDFGVEGGKA